MKREGEWRKRERRELEPLTSMNEDTRRSVDVLTNISSSVGDSLINTFDMFGWKIIDKDNGTNMNRACSRMNSYVYAYKVESLWYNFNTPDEMKLSYSCRLIEMRTLVPWMNEQAGIVKWQFYIRLKGYHPVLWMVYIEYYYHSLLYTSLYNHTWNEPIYLVSPKHSVSSLEEHLDVSKPRQTIPNQFLKYHHLLLFLTLFYDLIIKQFKTIPSWSKIINGIWTTFHHFTLKG